MDYKSQAEKLHNKYEKCIADNRHEEAISLLEELISLQEKTLGPDHPDVATSLSNLANVYYKLGDYQKAESLCKRSLEISEKTLGPDHPHVAASLNNLAGVYYNFGDYQKAESLYKRSLEISEKTLGPDHPDVATSLSNLAIFYISRGQIDHAKASLLRAIHIQNRIIKNIMGFADEKQAINFISSDNMKLFLLLNLINKFFTYDSIAKKEVFDLWLLRKGIVLEVQKRFQEVIFCQEGPEALNLFHSLQDISKQLQSVYHAKSKDEDPDTIKKRIAYLEDRKNLIRTELIGLSNAFKTLETVWDADVETIFQLITAGSAIVDFALIPVYDFEQSSWGPDHYFAFILPAGRPDNIELIDLGEAAPIENLIARFKKEASLRGGRGDDVAPVNTHYIARKREQELKRIAKELFEKVFFPLEDKLVSTAELFLSPDGQLSLIPFEALVDSSGNYLIEKYTFNYITAPREMVSYASHQNESSKSLIMGAPDYNMDIAERPDQKAASARAADILGEFAPLDATLEECERVYELVGQNVSELYTGIHARESTLMNAASPRFLHLSTHGFFLEDTPKSNFKEDNMRSAFEPAPHTSDNPLLRSGIALAGANKAYINPDTYDGEGIVTAEKILNLRLRGTDMVVLSACETGLGDVKNGEGVFGLRRAFTQAGAKSMVMSMWRVPDKETKDLMVAFYGNIINKNMDRCGALREAALSIKNLTKDEHGHTHPYFWGAFVFAGDAGTSNNQQK